MSVLWILAPDMNNESEFDVGPLTWVKSEIDLALERADQALQQFLASAAVLAERDLTQIRFSRTHLHQVQGALTIVGLDGLVQFSEALEALLEALEKQLCPPDEATIDLVHRALEGIRLYLDDLIVGKPNQPLRLLPLYTEIQNARGIGRFSPADLFFPDLSQRPPKRGELAPKLPRGEFQRLVRQERARFQRGLLSWLRDAKNQHGVSEMLAAVQRIEATQEAASARTFWWVATAFLTALADGSLPPEANVKQLCARVDLQIRRLLEGSKNVAERLLRDALYFTARAESESEVVQEVRQTFRLPTLLPQETIAAVLPQESLRRRLRDIIAAAEEAWNKYCSGSAQALPMFKEHAAALAATVEQLGHTDYRRLAQAIAVAANWLSGDGSRRSDALAMEVATAILLAQNAQENFQRLGGDFAYQVDVTVARIHGCIAGTPPQPGSEIPLLDEMSRRAQEKLLVGQVAREIQSNLAQIEQVLDAFFRDDTRRADLAALQTPLHQVAGALTIMRQEGAVAALRQCADDILRFADPDYVPQEADFERVASELSLIGFFVDAMQHGAGDFATFVRQMQSSVTSPPVDEDEVPDDDAEIPQQSVEQEVEQQKRETHALLGALMAQPDDAGLREEVKQNLTALQSDADLLADAQLGAQAKAMLSALASGEAAAPQIEQVMATLKPQGAETPLPSAQSLQLSQSSNEVIDAELLGIFLEEANDVLASIHKNVQALHEQPHSVELLTTIRRSFHTLKGSGRMVGLKDVGEAAWAIEQTLNLWLRQEQAVTPALFELIELAHQVFSVWVRHLENRSGAAPDPAAMVALAESLRQTEADAPSSLPPSGDMTKTIVTRFIENEVTEPEPAEVLNFDLLPLDDEVASVPESDSGREDFPLSAAQGEEIALPPLSDMADDDFPPEDTGDHPDVSVPDAGMAVVVQGSVDAEAPDSPASAHAETEPSAPAPASSGISPGLLEVFSEEAQTHLATLWRELPVIEESTLSPTPHEMYRAAHTLAGISSTLGFVPVNQLGHALELTLLRRDHAAQPGSLEALGVIRLAIGELEQMLATLLAQRELVVPPGLVEALNDIYPAEVVAKPRLVLVDDAAQPSDDAECPGERETLAEAEPATAPELPRAATPALISSIPSMKDEIDAQLLPIFLEEAQDLKEGIATQLRAWRAEPSDSNVVHTLARLLHTLKGSARMAGAMTLGEIAHAIESRVEDASRSGAAPLAIIDEIENAFDDMLLIIERLQQGELPGDVVDSPLAVARDVPPVLSVPVTTPPVIDLPPEIPESLKVVPERHADAEAPADGGAQRANLRVRADLIDRLVNDAGELSIARARIEGEMHSLKDSLLDLTENVIRLRRQLRDIEIQAESQMLSRHAQADVQHSAFDPLEFDRFTRFQELTRMMAESVNDVATVQQNLLKNLDDANAAIVAQARLNREIQQELMGVRMVPFGSLADRLYQIARQTSKELNKRVNLEIFGAQVALDRSVLDKMAAPLEHMLRNAIAHGLEPRETRLARGKAEIGDIAVSARQEGNEIILSLKDDGGGLDYAAIRQRAIQVKLLGADEAISNEHLGEMIFLPGFTTATALSRVAGRGVGMDVVRDEVARLGGRIETTSEPGKGTEFRLYIPLTLAVTKALLVRVGNRRYAIPSVMIEQVLDLRDIAMQRIQAAGSAEWLGNHYPYTFLSHLLGDAAAQPEPRRKYWVLLLRAGNRRLAVQVDELMGNREIVVKNIGEQLSRVVGISGATVLGDGQVVLILNPVALSTRAPQQPLPIVVTSTPVPEETASRVPTIMVVDDSLTVRKITGRLLAREGYQVLTAKDGVDALEKLSETVPDVMLVDVEMPRLDGFDLTRNIRADAQYRHVPIIMITSRTAEKHRNYAFEVGVNHFLGKPYQEEELLKLVATYASPR